jgi:hypothetical protein
MGRPAGIDNTSTIQVWFTRLHVEHALAYAALSQTPSPQPFPRQATVLATRHAAREKHARHSFLHYATPTARLISYRLSACASGARRAFEG